MNTSSATTEPSPETVKAGAASISCDPESWMVAAVDGPSISPPQRAPYPVEDIVASPASKRPFTVIVPPSETRNETPSWTLMVEAVCSKREPSSVYGLH